jgi:hypothetical protein
MSNTLVWSSDKELMKKQTTKIGKTVFLVLEDCCNHFTGLFATEAEAKACVEEYGDGFSYSECVI